MFTIICPHENAEVLLGPRCIERLENTDDGVVIHWRCYCGTAGHSSLRRSEVCAGERSAAA